jgi:general secretion pathway protein A
MATSTPADDSPFSTSPDPFMLYLTPNIKTALHKVKYVIDRKQGLTTILGDVGMGKSSLLRYINMQFRERDDVVSAYIPSPNFPTDFAFLKVICGDFGVASRRSMVAQEQELRAFLTSVYSEGKTAILFIDEAQKLTGKQLEMIRVMLNIETHKAKLIQIVLAAQLELRDKLKDPTKKALRSRIIYPSHLSPLSLLEAREMIAFRCETTGVQNPFSAETVEAIYNAAQGVPREILKVAAAAYDLAQMRGISQVPPEAIPVAVQEMGINLYE